MEYFLAIDIGATSLRHMVGYEDFDNQIKLEEVYRARDYLIAKDNELFWDLDKIFNSIIEGIYKACSLFKISSISVDSWAVDYVILNSKNEFAYSYRSERTLEIIDEVHNLIPFAELYRKTGIQFQPFNTIYQLYKDKKDNRLTKNSEFLMIPEYIIYKLTGKKVHEYTNHTTTGMVNVKTQKYDSEVINKLGLPEIMFSMPLQKRGVVGKLKSEFADKIGYNVDVKLCQTHDTASAIYAISDNDNPYISSGTWSLFGIKNNEAIISDESLKANYSNEGGNGYFRVQKNIMGLWIIEKLRNEFGIDIAEAIRLAKISDFKTIYDCNDEMFLAPKNMKEAIVKYFAKNNLKAPTTVGDYFNSSFHSLAYSYKLALEELERITGKKYSKINIVGGGANNDYLNELTAFYTNVIVEAHKIEASAIGNIKAQMEV